MSDAANTPDRNYTRLAFTPSVKKVQEEQGSRRSYARMEHAGDRFELGANERAFIATRDSFYMASVGDNGWPYVQHRGGPKGFLRVVDSTTLAFADFSGNKQYISTGNVLDNRRVALILMDYAHRRRLKVWAGAEIIDPESDPELATLVDSEDYPARIERIFRLDVQAWDWNCPQHITQRFTVEELVAIREMAGSDALFAGL